MVLGKVIEHEIRITPTINRGFIVRVGCATACFSNTADLLADLQSYLVDPKGWEADYYKLYVESVPTPTNEGLINYIRRETGNETR